MLRLIERRGFVGVTEYWMGRCHSIPQRTIAPIFRSIFLTMQPSCRTYFPPPEKDANWAFGDHPTKDAGHAGCHTALLHYCTATQPLFRPIVVPPWANGCDVVCEEPRRIFSTFGGIWATLSRYNKGKGSCTTPRHNAL